MKKYPLSILMLIILLLPSACFALDMEFYTYNGFGPVTQAFQKIALIFSDLGYRGLFFTIMALGLASGVAVSLIRAKNGRAGLLSWAIPVVSGIVVYFALFIPTGSLTIYDTVLNRFERIEKIPQGIVFIAGILNKIEHGIIQIIDKGGIPNREYSNTSGGIGLEAVRNLILTSKASSYIEQSTEKYINDCVLFEIVRPSTTLTYDELNSGNDYIQSFDKASNKAIYTVVYNKSNPAGDTITCSDAWNTYLKPFYVNSNDPSTNDSIKAACGSAGFNPANPAELQSCKDLISSTTELTTGISTTPENLTDQAVISKILEDIIKSDSPSDSISALSNRRLVTTGFGIGIALNEQIPIIKALMTALIIGLTPLLVLFIPTPLFSKALFSMIGFFLFLTLWGVIDAIIHGAAMDYSVKTFELIKQSGLGLQTYLNFPDVSMKTLAMFGMIRSSGLAVASFLSMILFKFGGYAFSNMGDRLSSYVQSSGSEAGTSTATPEGLGKTVSALREGPTVAWTNAVPYNTSLRSGINSKIASSGKGAGIQNVSEAYFKGDPFAFGEAEGSFSRVSTSQGAGQIGAFSGKPISSNLHQGHERSIGSFDPQNPTTSYHTPNLGAFGIDTTESWEAQKASRLSKANEAIETSSQRFSLARQQLDKDTSSLSHSINNSHQFTDSEKQEIAKGLSSSSSIKDTLADKLSKEHGFSKDKTANAISDMSGQIGGKIDSGGFLGQFANMFISGNYGFSSQDQEKYGDVYKAMTSEERSKLFESVTQSNAAFSQAHNIAESRNDAFVMSALKNHESSYSSMQSASKDYSTALSEKESFEHSWSTAEKTGLLNREKLDGAFMQYWDKNWGKYAQNDAYKKLGKDTLLSDAVQGYSDAKRFVGHAINDFKNDYINDMIKNSEAGKSIAGASIKSPEHIGSSVLPTGNKDVDDAISRFYERSNQSINTGIGNVTQENYNKIAGDIGKNEKSKMDSGVKAIKENQEEMTREVGEYQDSLKLKRIIER